MMWRLVLLGTVAAVAFGAGWRVHSWRDGAQQVKAITRTVTVTRNVDHIITVAGVAAQAAQDHIAADTKAVIQEVPQDVPTGSPADVRLGAGWVRNYDRSLGLPEGAGLAGLPADQPVISAADALTAIDWNNGQCRAGWDAYQRLLATYDQVQAQVNEFKP